MNAGLLEDRVAVVTGGASGIGRAIALRVLAEGGSVVVGDLNAESGKRLVSEVDPALASRFRFAVADAADESAIAELVQIATTDFGQLDVMFNNAGIGGAFGPITDIAVEHWDRTFAVLARGVFLGTKHAARAMIARGAGGSIVNTASIAGLGGGGGPSPYSAAKAAVVNLTYTTAVELAAHGIRVNAVCPGFVLTPLAVGRDEQGAVERVSALQPWPEPGRPEDIASLACWLGSDEARFVTGEAVRADGGLLAAGPKLHSAAHPTNSTSRYSGFTNGTTGLPMEKRRLENPTR